MLYMRQISSALFLNNRSYVCFDDGKSALTAGFMNPSGEIVFLFTQSEF